jgi:hypothetical protein
MTMSNIVKRTEGTVAREGATGRELELRGETAAVHEQASARAEIEARYTMAQLRRRDPVENRSALLRDCQRPGFARRAFYSVPRRTSPKDAKPGRITGTVPSSPDQYGRVEVRIEGLSVRYAETAVRTLGNIESRTRVVYEDAYKRRVQVGVVDLETNSSYADEVLIDKTIERNYLPDDKVALGTRKNSAGKDVYILPTTEEELRQKQQALVSRVFRTLVLRLVPPDTLEECEMQIGATVKNEAARDPDAERKAVADAFASLNVMPADLKAYIGHELGTCTPAEIVNMRGLYEAIREGEITWAEAVKEKTDQAEAEAKKEKPKTAGGRVAASIEARVKKQKERKGEPKPDPKPAAATTTAPATTGPTPTAQPMMCAGCGVAMIGTTCGACGWVVGERIPD